jgi:hypothetical protein
MRGQWVDADRLREPSGERAWDVDYGAHPLLDPAFPERPSRLRRFLRAYYDRIRHSDQAYDQAVAAMLHPPGAPADGPADRRHLAVHLREVDAYLREVVNLLPASAQAHAGPSPPVADCDDLRDLLTFAFTHPDRRTRYEAQRKLYLSRLFLQIDQSRHVQDGPRHKAYFEELLEAGLWRHARQVHEVEIGYNLAAGGEGIEYSLRPTEGQQTWTFRSVFLERDGIPLDILYYACRFKRSVDPVTYEIVDGRRRVLERKRWGEMRGQTSGSIISKMIRRGIDNPDEISDIIGAMFIVHDDEALDDLLRLLDGLLGSAAAWRNVVDTLASPADSVRLNVHSGRGYRVLKGDVDILYPDPVPDRAPYRFPVEIQIYTLESFLRTVCGAHEANHFALKLRQFLFGLVPRLFPRSIYGTDWLRLD